MSVLQVRLQSDVVNVLLAVTQVMDICLSIQPGIRFEEIRAQAFGREVGGKRFKICARQELAKVQLTNVAFCIISHSTLVEVGLQCGACLT